MADPKRAPVYRVRNIDGDWAVFDRDDRAVSDRMRTQTDAVVHAKELARRDGIGQIVVYDLDGQVMSEFFYERAERAALKYDDSSPFIAASHATSAAGRRRGPLTGGARSACRSACTPTAACGGCSTPSRTRGSARPRAPS